MNVFKCFSFFKPELCILEIVTILNGFQDIYGSLSSAGFSQRQIEQAMENTILHGGDLIDALDWLCLNTPNGWQHLCTLHLI